MNLKRLDKLSKIADRADSRANKAMPESARLNLKATLNKLK